MATFQCRQPHTFTHKIHPHHPHSHPDNMDPLMRAIEMTSKPEQCAVLWSVRSAEGPAGPRPDFVGSATSKNPLKYLFETEAIFTPAPDMAQAAATPKPWGRHQSLGRHFYGACVTNAQAMGILPAHGDTTGFVEAHEGIVEALAEDQACLDGVYIVPMLGDVPLTTRGDRPSSLQDWPTVFKSVYDFMVSEGIDQPSRDWLMSELTTNPRKYAVVGCEGDAWTSPIHKAIYKDIFNLVWFLNCGPGPMPNCPKLSIDGNVILPKLVRAIMHAPVVGVNEGVGESTSPVKFADICTLDEDPMQCMQLVGAALATQEGRYHPEFMTFRGYIPGTKYLCTRVRTSGFGEEKTTHTYVSRKAVKVGGKTRDGDVVTSCTPYKSIRALYTYEVQDLAAFNEGHRIHKQACLAHAANLERATALGVKDDFQLALLTKTKRKRVVDDGASGQADKTEQGAAAGSVSPDEDAGKPLTVAVAQADCDASHPNYLSYYKGCSIIVTSTSVHASGTWWEGYLKDDPDKRVGEFPASDVWVKGYVSLDEESAAGPSIKKQRKEE